MQTCTKCKTDKPATEFYRDRRQKRGTIARCKACKNAATRDWVKANDYDRKRYRRNKPAEQERHLKRKYGITLKDYSEMLEEQSGSCAICGTPEPENKKFDVDHDHQTGDVRGLLCTSCNRMLGHGRDNPEILTAGAKYLSSRK